MAVRCALALGELGRVGEWCDGRLDTPPPSLEWAANYHGLPSDRVAAACPLITWGDRLRFYWKCRQYVKRWEQHCAALGVDPLDAWATKVGDAYRKRRQKLPTATDTTDTLNAYAELGLAERSRACTERSESPAAEGQSSRPMRT